MEDSKGWRSRRTMGWSGGSLKGGCIVGLVEPGSRRHLGDGQLFVVGAPTVCWLEVLFGLVQSLTTSLF